MATINVSLPADGTTADVADFNTPITTIVSEFNGNIDNANIKSAAAIAGSKIADNSIDLESKASADSGWRKVTDSWTYASSTTITVPSDATTKYSVGDKLKLTNSSTKYFYITAVASTTLTVSGGSDYTLANAAITDVYFSKASTPLGFPQYFAYTPTYTNFTVGNATVATRFSMAGKTINFRGLVTLGSTSAMSTGPRVSLPVTASSTANTQNGSVLGMGMLNDTGTQSYLSIIEYYSTTELVLLALTGSGSVPHSSITSSSPFAWGNTDSFAWNAVYEAA